MKLVVAGVLAVIAVSQGQFQGPPAPTKIGVDITMSVTAYCYSKTDPKQCDHKYSMKWGNSGHTASGKKARVGMCAADWAVFPPGTIFYVPGYGRCVVEDRGSEVLGRELDVFLLTPYAAKKWGRQNLNVTLIKWGKLE